MSYQLYNSNVPVTPIEHLHKGRETFEGYQEPRYPQSPQRRAPPREYFSSASQMQAAAAAVADAQAPPSMPAVDELKQIKYLLIGVIVLLLLLLILRR